MDRPPFFGSLCTPKTVETPLVMTQVQVSDELTNTSYNNEQPPSVGLMARTQVHVSNQLTDTSCSNEQAPSIGFVAPAQIQLSHKHMETSYNNKQAPSMTMVDYRGYSEPARKSFSYHAPPSLTDLTGCHESYTGPDPMEIHNDNAAAMSVLIPKPHMTVLKHHTSEDVAYENKPKAELIGGTEIAEMEAKIEIHGLQIIPNVDLEELRELGFGTFGAVYHGKWRGTNVAIKRIKNSCFAGKSSEQERLTKDFWREAQMHSNLHHPNVVALYGVVPDGPGGTLSTVTEYMTNGSLKHVLLKNNRALDWRKKLIIAQDAAFGMEYLHLKNIIHFDLKCENLLVSLGDRRRPICKVGDFGLSKIKRNTFVTSRVRGTLPWMAPELINSCSTRVSEKVDVFSFGIVMWEILTEEEPYKNMHYGAIIGGVVNNILRPTIPDQCDGRWKALMEECWSHDPAARPTFTEIKNKLQQISMASLFKNI